MKQFLTVLPLSIVMIAGPQLISAVFLATTEGWRRNTAAYLLGAALSITLVMTVGYFLARLVNDAAGQSHQSTGALVIDIAILVLLLLLAARVFLKRHEAEPPKWMGRLQTASPAFSFKLGFALLGVFPTDIITSLTVGAYLTREHQSWWHGLGFVALTLLLLAIPAILVLLLGARAKAMLPKVRDWMNTHSWVVNEIVIVLFIAITISNLADD